MIINVETKQHKTEQVYDRLPDKPGVYEPISNSNVFKEWLVIRLKRPNELLYVCPNQNIVEVLVDQYTIDFYSKLPYRDANQEVVLRFATKR